MSEFCYKNVLIHIKNEKEKSGKIMCKKLATYASLSWKLPLRVLTVSAGKQTETKQSMFKFV